MTRRDLTSETAQDHYDVEAVARRRGIQPYQVRATGAVNDRLMAEIVSDGGRSWERRCQQRTPREYQTNGVLPVHLNSQAYWRRLTPGYRQRQAHKPVSAAAHP